MNIYAQGLIKASWILGIQFRNMNEFGKTQGKTERKGNEVVA
jgi:hypothetical protein